MTLFLFIYLFVDPSDWIIWLQCTVDGINWTTLSPCSFVWILSNTTSSSHCKHCCLYIQYVTLPPHAHLYLMMRLRWVQGTVTTNYMKGHYILLPNDNRYFNLRQWITAMPSIVMRGIPGLRYYLLLAITYFTPNQTLISTNHCPAQIIWAEEVLQYTGTPASHRSIKCHFPCGTSVASNCTQKYGWMRGFNRAVLVGALRQTSKFRWHQLVHFNYPLILSALNKAHAKPGSNGLS